MVDALLIYKTSYLMKNEEGHLVYCSEEDPWVECRIKPLGKYTYSEITIERADPSAMRQIGKLTCALTEAFEAGRVYQQGQIKKALGI